MTPARQALTSEQDKALTTSDVSVALTAGAGCGKTFVLTERFLLHLEPTGGESADLSQIVAITFTERAAREMRDRIRQKCQERIEASTGEDARYWLDLWRDLDSARVSTIHSFCTTFLRTHAVEARLDPQFSVLQQAQADTLLSEVLDDQIRDDLARREETTVRLAFDYGLTELKDLLQTLITRFRRLDWTRWLELSPEELVTIWHEHYTEHFLPNLLAQFVGSKSSKRVLEIMRDTRFDVPPMNERRATLLERLPRLAESKNPLDDLMEIHEAAKVKGAGKKTWPDAEVYELFKTAATALRKEIDRVKPFVSFDRDSAWPAAQAGCDFLRLAVAVIARYDQAKQQLAALDFEDLLIRMNQVLTDPAHAKLRRAISSQIRALLVDEFQDTDATQVELVKSLCGEDLLSGKLFFVGDIKQSIYRFRGAQPRVFEQLWDQMPECGRLPLSMNFRSQPGILHFVNALFCERLGDGYQALRAHRSQLSSEPSVEFLWAASDEKPRGGGTAGAARRAREREADWIARRISELLTGSRQVIADRQPAGGEALRSAEPGDIAILFRALTDVEIYEEALRNHGIEYYLVGGHAFYAQQEIYDLLNLLRAVASFADDVSLAGALRSPIFGLTDEALFWLAQHEEGLNSGLLATPPSALDDSQRQSVARAAETIQALRRLKDRVGVAELINEALRRTGYDAVLLAEFLGERKLANLRKLIDQARENDRGGFGLADFLVQLSQFVANKPNESLATTQAESANIVRLMTIHQAKGLEFPIVIVPDLARKGDHRGARAAVSLALGPLVPLPRKEKEKQTACTGLEMYKAAEAEDERHETDRLLYVACTRAADHLILSSSIFPDTWPGGPWPQLLAERFDLRTGACRGTLPPGYDDPRVSVTTEQPQAERRPKKSTSRLELEKWTVEIAELADRGEAASIDAVRPIPIDAAARRQFSFSRLSGLLHLDLTTAPTIENDGSATKFQMPDESDGLHETDGPDPRQLGTLVHDVLEQVDFKNPGDIKTLIGRHASAQRLDLTGPEVAEAVPMVQRFLDSPIAAELAAARQIHRELEFMLAWPPDEPALGGRYLHGYIDCLYQAADGSWRILDYKTNRVAADQVAAAAGPYEMQMFIYALAVERVLGRTPDDLSLYFLRPAVAHSVRLDDENRARIERLVNQTMESAVKVSR